MRYAVADDRALGTSLRVVVTAQHHLAAAKQAVDSVIADIDQACSRFRDDSELSRLNREAGRETRVSPRLCKALAVALQAARETGGAVDPTVGTAMKSVGYVEDFAAMLRTGGPIALTASPIPGWRRIRLSEAHHTVFVERGVEIDLGSTAKALAADLAAAAAMRAAGAGGVLVSIGGDIAVAGEAPATGWQIQLSENSSDPVTDGAENIAIPWGGVATSSTTVRRWTRGEITLHHIIDPDTGLPVAGPWRTATVVSRDCVAANTAATAAIVLGQRAIPWMDARRLSARLVPAQGEVVLLGNWPR